MVFWWLFTFICIVRLIVYGVVCIAFPSFAFITFRFCRFYLYEFLISFENKSNTLELILNHLRRFIVMSCVKPSIACSELGCKT